MPTIRSISTAIALAVLAPLTVMATDASAAATSRNAWWTTHQPRSPLALNIAPARSTPDWLPMSQQPAGDPGLRAPLSDAFTSIELGAPPSAPVGANPSGIAVNQGTHTVYVVNDGDDTVSVIDADACNLPPTRPGHRDPPGKASDDTSTRIRDRSRATRWSRSPRVLQRRRRAPS